MCWLQGRMLTKALCTGTLILGFATAYADEREAVPGEYVVKLKDSARSLDRADLSREFSGEIVDQIPADQLVVVKRSTVELQDSSIATLSRSGLVEYAEPNYIYRATKIPNDEKLGLLWGMANTAQKDSKGQVGTAGYDIDAIRAWDYQTGSKDVVVAVIDSGVDYNLADLKDNMWVNEAEKNGLPGVDDDHNGYVDDVYGYDFSTGDPDPMDGLGHGSHCSGTIGAKGNDGKGLVGVAWNVRIMPVKFLSNEGVGTLANAVKAIDYATANGARIMNNSWGGGGYSKALFEAITRAHEKNILFVAAAGNAGFNNDETPNYPSNYEVPNILAVAAMDNKGQVANFSSFGKKTVHVAAPGVNIWSSTPTGYESYSGTSMATPHVSGIAALLASAEPDLKDTEIKERIIATAKPNGAWRNKVSSNGMANAYYALTNIIPPPDPNDPGNWKAVAANVSSSHPYESKANLTFEVSKPGATKIALYLKKFETEAPFDKVTVFDKNNNVVAVLTGNLTDTYSPAIPGDYAKLVFETDPSVSKYGFDITGIAYK